MPLNWKRIWPSPEMKWRPRVTTQFLTSDINWWLTQVINSRSLITWPQLQYNRHKVTKSQADLKGRSIQNIDCRDDAPASPTYRELQIDATAFLVQWWIRKRLHQNIRMHKIWFEWDQCRPEFKSIDKFLSSFSHFAHTLRDQSVVRTIMFDHFLAWRLMCSTANLRLKSDRVIQWLRPVQDYLWNTHLHSPNLEIQGMSCEPKPNLRQEASTLDVWLVLPSGRPSRTMSPHRTWVHQVLTIFFLNLVWWCSFSIKYLHTWTPCVPTNAQMILGPTLKATLWKRKLEGKDAKEQADPDHAPSVHPVESCSNNIAKLGQDVFKHCWHQKKVHASKTLVEPFVVVL